MSQHFTSNTVSAEKWCNKCQRFTQHAVSGHRIGHCIACLERMQQANQTQQRLAIQTAVSTRAKEIEYQLMKQHGIPLPVVNVPLPCQCSAYPFAHYHSENSEAAKRGRWEAARKGYLL